MENNLADRPTLEGWVRDLFRGLVQPYGDYFERLATRIEASAPVSEPCCS